MNVRFLVANGLVIGAMGWMAGFAGMQVGATEVLPQHAAPGGAPLAELESRAAQEPASAKVVAALAAAYLERDQPGLASAVIEKAPRRIREQPEVGVLYARALFHRGRTRAALAVARDAGEACADSPSCPTWLVAKTARQVAFFEQVVAAGIDDPLDDPGATRAAYERSAREVRLVAVR